MTVVGLDDTDSRERGMCTTYVAATIARALQREGASVSRLLLVRLNPAVEYKTRGNAALAIHTDASPAVAFNLAREHLSDLAETADERTHPGLVVTGDDPDAVPDEIAAFTTDAIRDHLEIADARELCTRHDYQTWHVGDGRGRIGALAAIGAWNARSEWTYEHISYREPERWGTPREVDTESVFTAAESAYPTVWDTVDRSEYDPVCVPHTPGPILHGIRGDDAEAVRTVAEHIESEPVASSQLFVTNQGTDAHLRDARDESLDTAQDGYAYDSRVASPPNQRRDAVDTSSSRSRMLSTARILLLLLGPTPEMTVPASSVPRSSRPSAFVTTSARCASATASPPVAKCRRERSNSRSLPFATSSTLNA